MEPIKPGPFGPPAEDPWESDPHPRALDRLIEASLTELVSEGPPREGTHCYRGTMRFDDVALMGPPGRLQGGLHCVARVFPILKRIADHDSGRTFPCAINVLLEKPIALYEDVAFEARYRRRPSGGWALATRFGQSERLDAAAWSLGGAALLDGKEREGWRERLRRARSDPSCKDRRILGLDYRGTSELFWCEIPPREGPGWPRALRRFVAGEGDYSLAFLCYHMDVIGAIVKAVEMGVPQFTTRVSLSIASGRIPTSEPLLLLADRQGHRPETFSRARPTLVDGELRGTSVGEVLLADAALARVLAHGWVASHPIDLERMFRGMRGEGQ